MHINQLFDLSGQVAVVTGGAGNYGKCIVEALLEAGATVLVTSRNVKRAKSELQIHFGYQDRLNVLPLDQEFPDSVDYFLFHLKQNYKNRHFEFDCIYWELNQ